LRLEQESKELTMYNNHLKKLAEKIWDINQSLDVSLEEKEKRLRGESEVQPTEVVIEMVFRQKACLEIIHNVLLDYYLEMDNLKLEIDHLKKQLENHV
jgi:hypothetical protein